jgi:hypothetical protein
MDFFMVILLCVDVKTCGRKSNTGASRAGFRGGHKKSLENDTFSRLRRCFEVSV